MELSKILQNEQTVRYLEGVGILSVEQLLTKTEVELLKSGIFSKVSITGIKDDLTREGLALGHPNPIKGSKVTRSYLGEPVEELKAGDTVVLGEGAGSVYDVLGMDFDKSEDGPVNDKQAARQCSETERKLMAMRIFEQEIKKTSVSYTAETARRSILAANEFFDHWEQGA
jgi:hypothetical protein